MFWTHSLHILIENHLNNSFFNLWKIFFFKICRMLFYFILNLIFIFDWIFIYTSGWTGETGYVSAKTICAMMPKPSEDSLVLVRSNSILHDIILFHVNLAFYLVILDSNSLLLNYLFSYIICTVYDTVYGDFTAETNIIWIDYLSIPNFF